MGYRYIQAKKEAEREGKVFPSLSKYLIYGSRHKPRQTGYIVYLETNPCIRGVGRTIDIAKTLYNKSLEEYNFYRKLC